MNIEHISISRTQLWNSCEQAYKYRYHLKMASLEPEPIYFAYGKFIHKISEIYTKEKGQVPIENITKDILDGKILIEEGKLNPAIDPSYKKNIANHVRNIQTLTDKIGYDGELEWKFRYDLEPPHELFATGFIDRLIIRGDKYFIIDYKTTKKGFWRKNSNTIRKDLQLRFYARVVQKEFNVKAENIKAALFYLTDGQLIATNFTQDAIESAEKELLDTYKKIVSTNPDEVYGRVGDQCKRCDYRKICPFYSLT